MTQGKTVSDSRHAACERFIGTIQHSTSLGIEVLAAYEDRVRCRLPWREELVGNPDSGVLHGGAVFSFLDQVGGLANACVLYPNFEVTPTIDFRLDHLRLAEPGQAVVGEGLCYRMSPSVSFIRVTAWTEGQEDSPIATGLATYMRMKIDPSYSRETMHESNG